MYIGPSKLDLLLCHGILIIIGVTIHQDTYALLSFPDQAGNQIAVSK